MSRRRVLFVSHWSSCHGGSSIVLLQLVGNLDRQRFDPIVLCPEEGELPSRLAEIGVPVVIRRNSALSKGTLIPFVQDVAWYSRWLKQQDIQLVHSHSGGWRRSVLLGARIRGVPFVKHLQNIVTGVQGDFGYRWARRIIACSDAIGNCVRKDPRLRDRTTTIHNAVDIAAFVPAGMNGKGKQPRPLIGFVGQLIHRKGVDVLIRAMPTVLESVPDARLMIVGCAPPYEPEYERECHKLVSALRVAEHVEFVGYCRNVAPRMKAFDVFVLPTRAEAFGIVIVEAMAAGCPVVATAVGGIPEIISRPDLGTLIPPDDPEATATAILHYLRDADAARLAGEAGSRHVRAHFSVESMVRRIEAIYDDVLADRKVK